MFRRLLILISAGWLAACSALPSRGQPLPELAGTWFLRLTESGGFAGLSRTVTITNDGQVIALDDRADQTGMLQLTPEELAALKDQVSKAALNVPVKTDTGCADCFVYDLEIKTDNANFSVQLDDVTLPDSGLQPLVMYLQHLRDRALTP